MSAFAPVPALPGPRMIWHFGFQKTGTTAVQALMRKNARLLCDKVALFPRGRWTAALRGAAAAFLRSKTSAARADFQDEVRSLVAKVRADGHSVAIVSDENVLGLRLHDDSGTIFEHAASIVPLVAEAASEAQNEFHFFIRDPQAWLRSAHNQEVKQLRGTHSYDSWPARHLLVDWAALQAQLAALTPAPVTFHDMQADRAQGRLTGSTLLVAAGVDAGLIAQLEDPGAQNEALPDAALAFMIEVNKTGLKPKDIGVIRDLVIANRGLFK